MRELTIGRLSANDIVLNSPEVSREKHLVATIDEKSNIVLSHFGTNDTKIDGVPIKRSPLYPEHNIQIGNFTINGQELINKINSILYKTKVDFTNEYSEILTTLEEYEKKRNKLAKPLNVSKYIKIGFTLSVVIVLVAFPELVPDNLRYPLIALSGVLATLFSSSGKGSKKKQYALDDLEVEYYDILRCPKCRTLLLHTSSHKLKGLRKCISDRCDAKFEVS